MCNDKLLTGFVLEYIEERLFLAIEDILLGKCKSGTIPILEECLKIIKNYQNDSFSNIDEALLTFSENSSNSE